MNLKITSKAQGNCNVTLTSKINGSKASSVILPVTVVDSSKKLYTKYSFSIENVRFNGMNVDSNVLTLGEDEENVKYFIFAGSFTSDGLIYSAEAPGIEFDNDAFAEKFVANLEGESPNTKFYWRTLLSGISNSAELNEIYVMRDWRFSKKGFYVRRNIKPSDENIQFKNVVFSKSIVAFDEEPTNEIIYNKVIIDAETYPDFSSFEGCWTFDKDKYAIEGNIYVAIES